MEHMGGGLVVGSYGSADEIAATGSRKKRLLFAHHAACGIIRLIAVFRIKRTNHHHLIGGLA